MCNRIDLARRMAMFARTAVPTLVVAFAILIAMGSFAGAEEQETTEADVVGIVPTTATEAEIAAAEPLQDKLVGTSKDFPDTCDGVTTPQRKLEPNTIVGDRVDIGPPSIEVSNLVPGTTYSYCLLIHNRGTEEAGFMIRATEQVGSPDPNQKQELVVPKTVGLWLHPYTTEIMLAPGERVLVPYTLAVPDQEIRGVTVGGLNVTKVADTPEDTGVGIQISTLHKVVVTFPGGEAKPLELTKITTPRVLSKSAGEDVYPLRMVVTNQGSVVDAYTVDLEMSGIGRSVGSKERAVSLLLPNGAENVLMQLEDMPWIGLYHPTVKVKGRGGTVTEQLPWVLVIPSWPIIIGIVIAILLPIVVYFRRWRGRNDWRQYLDDEEFDPEEPVEGHWA